MVFAVLFYYYYYNFALFRKKGRRIDKQPKEDEKETYRDHLKLKSLPHVHRHQTYSFYSCSAHGLWCFNHNKMAVFSCISDQGDAFSGAGETNPTVAPDGHWIGVGWVHIC